MAQSKSERDPGEKQIIVQLGSGAFTTEEELNNRARYHFLQSIRSRCPAPLFELRDKLFPLYRDWADSFINNARDAEAFRRSPRGAKSKVALEEFFRKGGITEPVAKVAAEGRPTIGMDSTDPMFQEFSLLHLYHPGLDHMLKDWAQRFGLTHARDFEEPSEGREPPDDPEEEVFELLEPTLPAQYWACQWAIQTLWQWTFTDIGPRLVKANPPKWVKGSFMSHSGEATVLVPIDLNEPGWALRSEQASAFRNRARKAFKEFLDSYIKAEESAAKGLGLVPTQRKKQEHFDWLALFQVAGWSFSEIADSTGRGIEEDAIRHGVDDAARCVAFSRRPGQIGRKRKKPEN